MKFTDWFLSQLCDHTDDNCMRCQLQIDVPDVVWERWLREKK